MSAKRTRTRRAPEAAPAKEVRKTIELAEELGYAYREYAHYTLLDRAIADVRDGFKPVHRRIIYAMGDMGLGPTAQHRKCARVVGEVLGKYHPHGDQSVYDALARMAQDFSLREVLIDGQGNFGSIDGDEPAAMRYTECRLAHLGAEMLRDIDMDTVDWQDNFDNSLKEPTVVPGRFPNVLVNGSSGIAVGFAANLPPHNLGEVCDAVTLMCSRWSKRSKIAIDDLLQVIPGPDFPTGGLVYRYRTDRVGGDEIRSDAIRAAYETGSAGLVCQARMDIERQDGARAGEQIVITEIPYGQQKSTIIQRIASEAREGKITGVVDIVDESDREGMRVVVQISRQADAGAVLEMLVRRSTLRATFGVNNLVLVPRQTDEGRLVAPRVLGLKEILEQFVLHRLEVIRRRSRYELERRKARLHVVEGLLIALDNIDEVIDIIRRSRTTETASQNLQRKFKLSEIQATAILDMQLRRLAAMERNKLKDEKKELEGRIAYLEALLASEARQLAVIKEETAEIKEHYATPRRTTIVDTAPADEEVPVTAAALAVPVGPQEVVWTTAGLTRVNAAEYVYEVSTGVAKKDTAVHCAHVCAQPGDAIFLVSTAGQVWIAPVGRVPQEATLAQLGLGQENIVHLGLLTSEGCLVLGTRQGRIKRTEMSVLAGLPERTWCEIMGLKEDDRVLFAGTAGDTGEVLLWTASKALRFKAEEVGCQQTPSAQGVIGIKLAEDDPLLGGAVIVDPKSALFLVSEGGYIKRVPVDEFPIKGRGTMGVAVDQGKTAGPSVAWAAGPVTGSTTVDVVGEDGKLQRMSLRGIPVENRTKQGKKLVKVSKPRRVILLN